MNDNTNVFMLAAGSIATILTALKLPQLYNFLLKRSEVEQKMLEHQQICERRLIELTTAVSLLLTLLENEFDGKEEYQKVIFQVKNIINNENKK